MSAFELAASLVGSLAWPIAAMVIVALFRSELQTILKRVTRVRLGSVEFDISRAIDRIERAAEAGRLPSPPSEYRTAPGGPVSMWDELRDRATMESPQAAIIGAWAVVEAEVQDAAERLGLFGFGRGFRSRLLELTDVPEVDRSLVNMTREASTVRNAAAHTHFEGQTSDEDAWTFVDLARRLSAAWNRVGRAPT